MVELVSVTVPNAHKRGFNIGDRISMFFKLNMLTPSTRLSTHGRSWMGMKMRAPRGQHAPVPSSWVESTASTRWLGARATCEPWLIKAAEHGRVVRASLPFSLVWNAHASRPRARALGHQRVTSYEATMGGTAYHEHRKVAVGWTEVRASAASGLGDGSPSRPERVKGGGHAWENQS